MRSASRIGIEAGTGIVTIDRNRRGKQTGAAARYDAPAMRRRRLLRHAFTLCSAISLVLCVAVCVLWIKSSDGACVGYIRYAVTGQLLSANGYTLVSSDDRLDLLYGEFDEHFDDEAALNREVAECRRISGLSITSGDEIIMVPKGFDDGPREIWMKWELLYASVNYSRQDDDGRDTYRYRSWQAGGPTWLCVVTFGALPTVQLAWFVGKTILVRRRRRDGRCRACGYDVRAHAKGDRCPECGTAVG